MNKPQSHSWTVFIDGASRKNPGKAGAGIFITKDNNTVAREAFYLGIKTNNQAEYLALLLALFFIDKYAQPEDVVRIASDSELLVKQIKGIYRVKNGGLQPLHALARRYFDARPIEIMHVYREDNTEADKLANKGIDSKMPLPASFLDLLASHTISLEQ